MIEAKVCVSLQGHCPLNGVLETSGASQVNELALVRQPSHESVGVGDGQPAQIPLGALLAHLVAATYRIT